MSGISGIVNWNDQAVDDAHLSCMCKLIVHRGPDSIHWERRNNVGLGHANLRLSNTESTDRQPLWRPDNSCGIVADARLYNRDELRRRLGHISWLDDPVSDAALILAAYERWQESALDFLDGDFAFGIWDRKRNRVFAARDPFGVKPFFYWHNHKSLLFGSEPKQLLVLPMISVVPNDLIVGEYLFQKFEDINQTFFEGIHRLKPAHYLIGSPSTVTQHRYWNPDPTKEIQYPNHQDYLDHFRQVFYEAVEKRLHVDCPVTAQLSGGLDSSSIVVAAGKLYDNGNRQLPPFSTVSAIFEGLPCDESKYIQAVTEHAAFDSHRFSPLQQPLLKGLTEDLWEIDSPFADIQRGILREYAPLMAQTGSRLLLTGLGGDELVHEEYYLSDLALRKRYALLVREAWTASKTSWNSFERLLSDALRSAAPASLKRLYQSLRRSRPWQPPSWASTEFVDYFSHCSVAPPLPHMNFPSLTQETAFQFVNYPTMCWALEALEAQGAHNSFEVRHPFLDRQLVEYVLAIPFEQRIPGGQWKYLLRQGLAQDLPDAVRTRGKKSRFDSFERHVMSRHQLEMEAVLLNTDIWKSERYVPKRKGVGLIRGLNGPNKDRWVSLSSSWRVATLELWLRQLDRYNPASPS